MCDGGRYDDPVTEPAPEGTGEKKETLVPVELARPQTTRRGARGRGTGARGRGRGRGALRPDQPPVVGAFTGTVPIQKGRGWGPNSGAIAASVGIHGPLRGNLNRGVFVGQEMPGSRQMMELWYLVLKAPQVKAKRGVADLIGEMVKGFEAGVLGVLVVHGLRRVRNIERGDLCDSLRDCVAHFGENALRELKELRLRLMVGRRPNVEARDRKALSGAMDRLNRAWTKFCRELRFEDLVMRSLGRA